MNSKIIIRYVSSLLALINISCSTLHLEEQQKAEKKAYVAAESGIKSITSDEGLYWEKAIAEYREFDNNEWRTIDQAKTRSRKELAKRISIDLKSVDLDRSIQKNGDADTIIDHNLSTSVSVLLENVKVDVYEKYPTNEKVTAIAFITVKSFENKKIELKAEAERIKKAELDRIKAESEIAKAEAEKAKAEADKAKILESQRSTSVAPSVAYLSNRTDSNNNYSEKRQITVYITKTGAKYHTLGCRYLSKSCFSILLDNAKKRYTPCSICNPPR